MNAELLNACGLTSRRCGLNADWSVDAWCLGGGRVNEGAGLYLTDNEDGTMSLVFRDFVPDGRDGGAASITVLATFQDSQLASAIAEAIA